MARASVFALRPVAAVVIAAAALAIGSAARADCPPERRETIVVRPGATTAAAAAAPFEVSMTPSATGMLNVRIVLEGARPAGRSFEQLYLRRHIAPVPDPRAEADFAAWLGRAQESRQARAFTPAFSTRADRALVMLMIRADEAAHTLVEVHYAGSGVAACRVYLAPLGSWAGAAGLLPPTSAEARADAAATAVAATAGEPVIAPPAPESFLLSPDELAELLRPPMLPPPERRRR